MGYLLDTCVLSEFKKKLKDKAFARAVNRDDIINGAIEMGIPLELRDTVFGVMLVFMATLALAWVYAWRKGVFRWR